MFGFAIAAFSAAGLVALGLSRKSHRYFGLHRLFRRLNTTPGQERALRNILGDLREAAREQFRGGKGMRSGLGELFEAGRFDEERAKTLVDERKSEFVDLEQRFLNSLRQIHEVLDDEQRRIVADWIRTRRSPFGCGFAHRHHHHGHAC